MKMKGHDIKRVGTWNVRTLLQTGKLENLKVEMKRLKIDILGVSEMRWLKSGDFWLGEYRIIYSGTEDGRECKKSKEVFLNNICQDIDEALKVGLMDKAYGIVRTFFKERKVKITSIKEANGNIIYEEAEVAKCWKKYLEQLYREENMTIDAEINEEHQNNTEEIDQSIMREEFDKALVELKNKKAPGVDEIPAELIQNCGKNTKKIIYEIIKECYETGQVPTHASKIHTRIVLKRMERIIDELLTEDQFGFKRGKGTREAILALRQVIEKQNRKRKTTYTAFVDLEKAFDNVDWRNIPRGCRTRYIPVLTPELTETLNKYTGMFEENPFDEETIEEGDKLLKLLTDEKRKKWCDLLADLDMKRSSKKAWDLTKRLNNDPHYTYSNT
ncbi:uncharacterized protein LOC112684781 [Sipha flava]|uniref:Uncharacterized protein LOC112684781 n=1 Tax=Sipha flava TaxID=143950 RepID=A0A8B8FMS2_9HEMI|nr:uncharacterized protein LOC112684781 [Sipha flava]